MPESTSNSEMVYRTLGSTGEKVSAIGLGGWHIGLKYVDEQLGIRIVRTAIDRGITFMDNSWITTVEPARFAWGKLSAMATETKCS